MPPDTGAGIGDGECAGLAIRGFICGLSPPCMFGAGCEGAGEPAILPNVRPLGAREVTGVPLGMYPLAPAALIVTDDLRLWSPCEGAPLTPLLFTMVGAMAGTAGLMGLLPFTGEIELLPCCVCGPPTATTGGAPLLAIGGEEDVFLVALAYELRAVGC